MKRLHVLAALSGCALLLGGLCGATGGVVREAIGEAIGEATAPGEPSSAEALTPQQTLAAGLLAKSLCSGLWVNGREREDFLARDVLLGREHLATFELAVDQERRRVSAMRGASAVRTAAFHPGHGCTILAAGENDVRFEPVPIVPRLPDAETTPWPMGDLLPDPAPLETDHARLEAALARAFAENSAAAIGTRAVVIVHDGRLIGERYAPGFDRASVMIGWSMGKSLTSALIGTLIERGWLALDQPAPIAEWQGPDDPRRAITVRHLLQMSSGLRFHRIEADDEQFLSPANHHFGVYFDGMDVFRYSTERDLEYPPGTEGRYRNCDPLTLGRILRETLGAHGEDYYTYPQRALFDRIGARSFVLERDPWGNMILSGYDHGTPRDYARFGLLHLQDGVWQDERLLPAAWVDFVQAAAPAWPEKNYGGLFWVNDGGALPGVPTDAYWAAGAFGQYTVVVPSHALVVVRMGYSQNSGAVTTSLARLLVEVIEAVSANAPEAAASPSVPPVRRTT